MNSLRIINLILLLLILTITITGCADNPNAQANKQAHQAIDTSLKKYTETGSIEKALKELKPASGSGAAPEIANMLKAQLTLAQCVEKENTLALLRTQIFENTKQLTITNSKLNSLDDQITKLKNAAKSIDTKIDTLEETASQMETAAADKKDAIGTLQTEIDDTLAEADLAKTDADDIQLEADDILKQAKTSENPTQKELLEKEAYALLLGSEGQPGKAEYMKQYQQMLDQADELQSRLDILQKEYTQMEKELKALNDNIDATEDAKKDLALKSNLTKLNSQNEKLTGAFESVFDALDELLREYNSGSTDLLDEYDDISKIYNRTGKSNDDLKNIAKISSADIEFKKAKTMAAIYDLQKIIGTNLDAIAQSSANDKTARSLNAGSRDILDSAMEVAADAADAFVTAVEEYGKVQKSLGRSKDLKCPILKNYIALLIEQSRFASKTGDDTTAGQALDTANEFVTEVLECDPDFENSYLSEKIKG